MLREDLLIVKKTFKFFRKHFHADVRDVAKVKIIHGFGRDDEKRIVLMVRSDFLFSLSLMIFLPL